MERILTVATFCLALILSSTIGYAEEKTIIFGTNAAYPPMEFIDDEQQIAGVSRELMEAAGKEAGFKVKFIDIDWNGIFAGLATGNYDAICASVTITPERQKQVDFSIPYYTVKQAIIVPKDSNIKSLDDLKGKTAGTQINTIANFAVEKVSDINSRTYSTNGLAVEDLIVGRLDAIVCDDPVAANILMNPKYNEKLKISAVVEGDNEEQYAVAVVKGNKETLELINKGIKAIQEKGIDKEILNKWIKTKK